MPTPTEAHLKVIADQIEVIQNIHAEVGTGKPSRKQKKLVIHCLGTIGTSIRYIPDEFKEKYHRISWDAIDYWGTRGAFATADFNKGHLDRCERFLARQKSEIYRHSGCETEIQKGIIEDLQAEYEDMSESWRGQIVLPYVLISITAIFAAVRVGLIPTEVDLTRSQGVSFSVHGGIILFIVLLTLARSGKHKFEEKTENWYYTHTELYERLYSKWSVRISTLANSINGYELFRAIAALFWLLSFAAALFATILDPN